MNTPVSFPLAQLLKEKGFNKEVTQRWSIAENIDGDKFPICQYECALFNWNDHRFYPDHVSAPTIADVVMWFYEEHKVQLFLDYTYYDGFHYGIKWVKSNGNYGELWRDNNGEAPDGYDSWTEAYEVAVEYFLKNLI